MSLGTAVAHGAGDTPFRRDDGQVFDRASAEHALVQLQALAVHLAPECFADYPVALLHRMATDDGIAFMPLTYGYCPYALPGYARHRLSFHDPRLGPGEPRGAILGGAGIGVSARSSKPPNTRLGSHPLTSSAPFT